MAITPKPTAAAARPSSTRCWVIVNWFNDDIPS
jgi:hypothetical protein